MGDWRFWQKMRILWKWQKLASNGENGESGKRSPKGWQKFSLGFKRGAHCKVTKLTKLFHGFHEYSHKMGTAFKSRGHKEPGSRISLNEWWVLCMVVVSNLQQIFKKFRSLRLGAGDVRLRRFFHLTLVSLSLVSHTLPRELRDIPNLHTFNSNLRTYLFKVAYGWMNFNCYISIF